MKVKILEYLPIVDINRVLLFDLFDMGEMTTLDYIQFFTEKYGQWINFKDLLNNKFTMGELNTIFQAYGFNIEDYINYDYNQLLLGDRNLEKSIDIKFDYSEALAYLLRIDEWKPFIINGDNIVVYNLLIKLYFSYIRLHNWYQYDSLTYKLTRRYSRTWKSLVDSFESRINKTRDYSILKNIFIEYLKKSLNSASFKK